MIERLLGNQREVLNLAGGFIAVALVGLIFFIAWAFIFREMPANNREPMLMLLGIVSTNVAQVVGFFFGSSYGAKKQSETIDHLSKAALPATPQILTHPGDTISTKSQTQTKIE